MKNRNAGMKTPSFVALTALLLISASQAMAGTPMLVDAAWLSKNLNEPKLVLLHVGVKEEYDAGHIPGAQFIELKDLSLTREETDLSLQLPPADRLKTRFEKFGISNDSRIVLYFGKDWVSPTTRVYFTLDHIGLAGRTSILDGGMPAWTAAGGKLTKDVPTVTPGRLKVKANDDLVARYDWINANLSNGRVKVIDSRDTQFYTGANAAGQPRAGRIKGAKSIPFSTLVDDKNVFLSKDALRKKFSDAGVDRSDTVVTYCHVGQQATVDYFAAKMAGFKVRLFDGSYQEWSRHAELPIETDPKK